MRIATIAVYSTADAEALHVKATDHAMLIGPAPARDSYLDISRIIEAAQRSGAEAIHPGYGFLSENPDFAEACAQAGIVFVGAPAPAMRAMGSKSAAKALMERSGLPVLPGYHGECQKSSYLADQANRIGVPLVIKAVSGGGGRGMRVVLHAGEFSSALDAARQEASAAFGDDRVLLERYLMNPRHIEVQIFADGHGNVVHLFERECSVQRRHQKVIEEAPAPGLDDDFRSEMGRAAVAAARAIGYQGAGTVEFVVNSDGFFFLEMNTRLQVEHPVTEMVTGFDLVEWQLRIAAGEPLPVAQHAIRIKGHAIEARIYAEDPEREFAPSTGRLALFRTPEPSPNVRIDSGFTTGDLISLHYDALLAKLICHGATRNDALQTLRHALGSTDIFGVASTVDLLSRIVSHPEFAQGGVDTGFIARHGDTLLAPRIEPSTEVLAAVALCILTGEADAAKGFAATTADPNSPWHARDHWWLNVVFERELPLTAGGIPTPIKVRYDGRAWQLTVGGRRISAQATCWPEGRMEVVLDGWRQWVSAMRVADTIYVRRDGETSRLRLLDATTTTGEEEDPGSKLVAPIPGQVTQVVVTPGMAVERGQLMVVLEAMKTVFRLTSPSDGVVAAVSCHVGDSVVEGQVLVGFAEHD
jgi:3-methylcrotonyl-CoA carboxylase alpha subunit